MSISERISPALAPAAGRSRPRSRPGARLDAGRVLDVALALAILLFTAPLFLLISLMIWVQGDGSIFFGHRRIGRGGRFFSCYKFRSMFDDADVRLLDLLAASESARAEWARDQKLKRDPRVTAIGGFLRKTSLDELPQLINVLKGDMSLVGPRPIVEAERSRYGRRFAHYASVRPGITGLWQVSGRNTVTYRRRVAIDATYARRKSVALDCRILLATVPAVLFTRGAS